VQFEDAQVPVEGFFKLLEVFHRKTAQSILKTSLVPYLLLVE